MKRKKEVTIGLIAVVAFVIGYLGLNYLKGINLFSKTTPYYVELSNVGGVAVATPVQINGYKVGLVRSVDFLYVEGRGYMAKLALDIKPEVHIPQGSTIKVKTNVLSGAELVITTPLSATKYLSAGDKIPSQEQGDDIMATINNKILPSVEEAMPSLLATLKRVQAISESTAIDSILMSLAQSTRQLNVLMAQINRSTQPLPQMMSNMNAFSGSLVQTGKELEKVKVDTLLANLNATTTSLQAIAGQLTKTDNTAGLLLNDTQLYHRLDSLALSAEELLRDLKAHPKRYVKLSLF